MPLLCGAVVNGRGRAVQIGQAWIVLGGSVHGFGTESHDNSEHAGRGIHIRHPFVGAVTVADAGGAGHEIIAEAGTGNSLYQDCHLLVPVGQPPLVAIFQGGVIHGAGVNLPHCLFKLFQPFLGISLVDAENRFIFSGEGVAKSILQKTGRADDDRTLTVIFQHIQKLFPDVGGKLPGEQMFPQFSGGAEIAFFRSLADMKPPAVIGNNIGIEHIRTNIKRIMGLAMFRKFRNLCFADLPGKYHTAGFPADGAAADHSAAEQKVVVGSKIPAHQIFQAFVLGHGAVNNLLFCFFAENTPGILHLS